MLQLPGGESGKQGFLSIRGLREYGVVREVVAW